MKRNITREQSPKKDFFQTCTPFYRKVEGIAKGFSVDREMTYVDHDSPNTRKSENVFGKMFSVKEMKP